MFSQQRMPAGPTSNVIGVVLAGGKSSRMGRDKAGLTVDGQTLTEHSVARLTATGIQRVMISSNHLPDGVKDRIAHCGPLSAVDAILHEIEQNENVMGLLLLPVDMPGMCSESLARLIDYGCTNLRCCSFQVSPLPCFLLITNELKQVVAEQFERRRYAIKSLLAKLNADELVLDSQQIVDQFINLNTPQQWQNYVQNK